MASGGGVRVRADGTAVRLLAPPRSWPRLRPVRPRTVLVGALVLGYVAVCAAVLGRSRLVDLDLAVLRWSPSSHWPAASAFLSEWVLLGQRAVCFGLAAAWLGLRALRTREMRPLVTLGTATVLLDVSVGLAKRGIGRLGPLQLGAAALRAGGSTVFSHGTIFPSGHAANAVVTWGLLAWLARAHRRSWAVAAGLLAASVGLATIYLGTHWVSDVLAGWTAGALVLLAVPTVTGWVCRVGTRSVPGRRDVEGT